MIERDFASTKQDGPLSPEYGRVVSMLEVVENEFVRFEAATKPVGAAISPVTRQQGERQRGARSAIPPAHQIDHARSAPDHLLELRFTAKPHIAAASQENENEAEQICASRVSLTHMGKSPDLAGGVRTSPTPPLTPPQTLADVATKGVARGGASDKAADKAVDKATSSRRRAPIRQTSSKREESERSFTRQRRTSWTSLARQAKDAAGATVGLPMARSKHGQLAAEMSSLSRAHEASSQRLNEMEALLRQLHVRLIGPQADGSHAAGASAQVEAPSSRAGSPAKPEAAAHHSSQDTPTNGGTLSA